MNLQKYLSLPYTITLRADDGVIVARILELPGCSAHGETEAEAIDNVREAQRLWIEDAIEAGDHVPIPESEDDALPSGKWVQRAPRSLHKKLIQYAKKENVSLNQCVNSICAEAMGRATNRSRTAGAFPARGGLGLLLGLPPAFRKVAKS